MLKVRLDGPFSTLILNLLGDNSHDVPISGVTVSCEAKVPVLLLENFEHLTEDIECRPGKLIISLLPGAHGTTSKMTMLSLAQGGLVITSHYGCNAHGERSLFR